MGSKLNTAREIFTKATQKNISPIKATAPQKVFKKIAKQPLYKIRKTRATKRLDKGTCGGNGGHTKTGLFKVKHINANGFCPTNAENKNRKGAQPINMCERI